jgi:hypothetical protein
MKTKLGLLAIVLFVGSLLTACSKQVRTDEMTSPSHVTIQAVNGRYQFYVNGEPFFVKGVGLGMQDLDFLQASGANSFRTWGTHNAMQLLDSAHKYNMMVALGLGMGQELHGFDYNDTVAVARQLAKLKADVDTFRNHPSLLCWVAGNELNLGTNGIPVNPKAYDALHDIVGYIHKVDPHHPVTTTFAGVNKDQIRVALEHCPDLDFLSLQVYAGLAAIPELVKAAGITKPYAITEFGPKGHWECPSTAWGREIEEPSAVKAAGISERIQKGIVNDSSGFCIGSYAFVWGQKQERTPTWYGMFLKSGEATATVDELTKYWTGVYPANRAPKVDSIKLDNKDAMDNIYIKPGKPCFAKVYAADPENDSLTYLWAMRKEVVERSQGGARELEPDSVQIQVISDAHGELKFTAPASVGEYRIFSYVFDGKKKAGYANIPFFVK